MPIDLPPVHRHLEFMSPLSGDRASELVQFLASHSSGTVIDFGCGWASLLSRLLEASENIRGIGVDTDGSGFGYAAQRAADRDIASRLTLIEGDAKSHLSELRQGAICVGATHIWNDTTASDQPVKYAAALNALRRLVVRGAPVVYGEGIWSATPTEAAVQPLAGRLDEFVFLPDLVDLAAESGFVVMQVHEANQDEWDHFESGFSAGYAEWLATHEPQHPDYLDVLQRANRQRNAYFRGYRGIMGMAYLCLLAV